ncbi:MAG: hypothetical protein CFE43_21345 [Burkholderiales bacterium PBB3]|nr:MAG: hypothetical protein CFE43_21345 [Burkholderiales bacterium PBB3]
MQFRTIFAEAVVRQFVARRVSSTVEFNGPLSRTLRTQTRFFGKAFNGMDTRIHYIWRRARLPTHIFWEWSVRPLKGDQNIVQPSLKPSRNSPRALWASRISMLSDVFEHDSNFGSRPTHRTDQWREVESYAVADDTLQSHGIEHSAVLVNWQTMPSLYFAGGVQTVFQDRGFVERGICWVRAL